jgi:hypothetical protein
MTHFQVCHFYFERIRPGKDLNEKEGSESQGSETETNEVSGGCESPLEIFRNDKSLLVEKIPFSNTN